MKNPYRVSLGEIPERYIEEGCSTEIAELLNYKKDHCLFISGPSGSGKTVTMTMVGKKLSLKKEWIVVNIGPNGPLLEELISKLYDSKEYIKEFINGEVNLSPWGIGGNIRENPPASNLDSALERILGIIKRRKKCLLVCIDEVTNSEEICAFLQSFHKCIRGELPFFLLMAGLKRNINVLCNEKCLTFIYRAPKVPMCPLNVTLVASDYMSNLKISHDKAMDLAVITKGFPTAFQALGQIVWENQSHELDDLELERYDTALYNCAYKEIIDGLSVKEKSFLQRVLLKGSVERSKDYYEYRKALAERGVLDFQGEEMSVKLPRFREVFSKVEVEHSLW